MTENHLFSVQSAVSLFLFVGTAGMVLSPPVSAYEFISLSIGSIGAVTGNPGRKYFWYSVGTKFDFRVFNRHLERNRA